MVLGLDSQVMYQLGPVATTAPEVPLRSPTATHVEGDGHAMLVRAAEPLTPPAGTTSKAAHCEPLPATICSPSLRGDWAAMAHGAVVGHATEARSVPAAAGGTLIVFQFAPAPTRIAPSPPMVHDDTDAHATENNKGSAVLVGVHAEPPPVSISPYLRFEESV